jgi:hypothetical protein
MTRDAIQLMVYRRKGQLAVNPGALYDDGFHALEAVIRSEGGLTSLVHALERGEALALDVQNGTAAREAAARGGPILDRGGL